MKKLLYGLLGAAPAHQQKPRNSLPLSPIIAAQRHLCRLQAETETRSFRFLILPTQARKLAPPPLRSRLETKPNPSCLRKKLRSLTLNDTSGERTIHGERIRFAIGLEVYLFAI